MCVSMYTSDPCMCSSKSTCTTVSRHRIGSAHILGRRMMQERICKVGALLRTGCFITIWAKHPSPHAGRGLGSIKRGSRLRDARVVVVGSRSQSKPCAATPLGAYQGASSLSLYVDRIPLSSLLACPPPGLLHHRRGADPAGMADRMDGYEGMASLGILSWSCRASRLRPTAFSSSKAVRCRPCAITPSGKPPPQCLPSPRFFFPLEVRPHHGRGW